MKKILAHKLFILISCLLWALNAYTQNFIDDSIDTVSTSKKIKHDYYFKSGTSRARYVHIKERIDILLFINTLNWTEKEKLEIFNLYINTQYHNEPHEVELNKAYAAGTLKQVLQQNRCKLHQRLFEIAGTDGSNIFWENIELITNKYTDHSRF